MPNGMYAVKLAAGISAAMDPMDIIAPQGFLATPASVAEVVEL